MPENKPTILEKLRRNRLQLAAVAGAVALSALAGESTSLETEPAQAALSVRSADMAGPPRQTQVANPLPHFGFNTNKIWVEDTGQALAEAQSVASTGADTIRIITPYTFGGAEFNNDLNRYCNALYATEKYGLRLEIGLDGHFRDGKIGYFPTRASEMQKLHTGLFSLMSHLSKDSCRDQGGNPVKAQQINLDFNEPNYKQRYKQPGMGKNLANLLVYLAPLLRRDADNLHVGFNLTAAAVSLSEPNDFLSFIREFDQQLNTLLGPGQSLPFNDIDLNYYAFGQSSFDSLDSSSQDTAIEKAVAEIRSDFGQQTPIGIAETGAFSETTPDKERLYSTKVPPTVATLPRNGQGKFYEKIINLAACQHLEGVNIFHNSDDGADLLRTGVAYPDGTPKPSERIVMNALANLRDRSVTCK